VQLGCVKCVVRTAYELPLARRVLAPRLAVRAAGWLLLPVAVAAVTWQLMPTGVHDHSTHAHSGSEASEFRQIEPGRLMERGSGWTTFRYATAGGSVCLDTRFGRRFTVGSCFDPRLGALQWGLATHQDTHVLTGWAPQSCTTLIVSGDRISLTSQGPWFVHQIDERVEGVRCQSAAEDDP
jgi:hypothetical protein